MSLRRMNNKTTAMIGAASALTASLPAVGNVVTPANLPLGAVVITDLGLERLVSIPSKSDFLIVQGNGANKPLLKSEILNESRVTITKAKFKEAAQQITVIGFNGTTGSLPAANNTSFFIKIRKNDNDAGNRSQPMSLFAQFKTDATGTQQELAFGLAKVGTKNMEDEPANGYLKFDVISDGTTAAIGTATLAATNGSKSLTYSAAHSLAVGDLVFIAGATYEVAAVPSTTTVTLSTAFEGTTVTALATGTTYATNHGKLTGATNFGVRLTGIAAPFNVQALRDFFSDDSTLVTHVQGATEGTGAWQRVAMDEYMTYGFEGMNGMIGVPPAPRDQYVVEGGEYSAIEVRWKEGIDTLVTTHVGEGSVIVYAQLNGSSQLPGTLAAGEVANLLGAIATPTFVSTDLNK
jgi:hypothetical protein